MHLNHLVVFLVFISFAAVAEPDGPVSTSDHEVKRVEATPQGRSSFFNMPKMRNVPEGSYGKSGKDLLDHAIRLQDEGGGPDGLIHGSTHATDGEQTATNNGYPKGYEAFYFGEGKAIVVPPSQPMRITDMIKDIPKGLRGNWFKMYIATNVRPTHPLNILEEGTAYAWEIAGIADLVKAKRYSGNQAMQPGMEFIIYQLAALKSLDRQQPGYLERAPEAKELVKANLERMMGAYNLKLDTPIKVLDPQTKAVIAQYNTVGEDPRWITNWETPMPNGKTRYSPVDYIETFRKGAASSALREFTRKCLGEEWSKSVLGI